MIADTYAGLEPINPTTKAGTEMIGFRSETGTYNRDNTPCCRFDIAEEFIHNIDRGIRKIVK